ncbi:MAG: DUF362 domain-containing protein [Planctomycetota bacterium]
MDQETPELFDRRGLLKVTGVAALAAALAELLPGSFLLRIARAQETAPNAVVHLGSVEKSASYETVKEKIRASLQATRDLSLIKSGDLVVIKVVSNSPYKYPMVTHPWALQAVIEIVKERTPNVRVVDQVGFEHAFFTGDDKLRKGIQDIWMKHAPGAFISQHEQVASGMEALERNGLKGVAEKGGAQVFSGDHDADYIQVPNGDPQYGQDSDPEFAHWTPWTDIEGKPHPRGFRVNKFALGFDPKTGAAPAKPPHVISISRISAHIWAGTTGPTKAYYGWIHPQDRVHSHTDIDPIAETPINVLGNLVPFPHPEVRHQNERITEVAAFFQRYMARIRDNTYFANLVVALDTYSDIGPDWGVQPLPEGRGVIGASEDVVALDAVATAKLVDYIRSVPESERLKKSRGQRWNVLDLFTSAGRDRIENAWQTLNYSKTRGLWNTFFGASAFVNTIDKRNTDPTVWEVGQVRTGIEMGLARNVRIDLLDDRAKLSPAGQALMANQPESEGFLKKLDTEQKQK